MNLDILYLLPKCLTCNVLTLQVKTFIMLMVVEEILQDRYISHNKFRGWRGSDEVGYTKFVGHINR